MISSHIFCTWGCAVGARNYRTGPEHGLTWCSSCLTSWILFMSSQSVPRCSRPQSSSCHKQIQLEKEADKRNSEALSLRAERFVQVVDQLPQSFISFLVLPCDGYGFQLGQKTGGRSMRAWGLKVGSSSPSFRPCLGLTGNDTRWTESLVARCSC